MLSQAAKRALYILLQHAEVAVDMVVEEDIGPTLNSYKLLILADTHVSQKASTGLAAWVAAGGTILATAGAGMFDELNKTNIVLSKLLGISAGHGTYEPTKVQFIKQDLINASVMGQVSWGENNASSTTAGPSATTTILGRFQVSLPPISERHDLRVQTSSAASHCGAPLRLPLPPAARIF